MLIASIWSDKERKTVSSRFTYSTAAYEAMRGLERHLKQSGLDANLLHLMKMRASQMNGCAYCIDMHSKDLRAGGDTEQRLYGLDAWRECPYYTDKERAALAWTEALTELRGADGVSDSVYAEVRQQFSETEIADLSLAVATINAWNRLAISARMPAGTYQVRASHVS
jgi:AhpD family alkylhydroperoxidase